MRHDTLSDVLHIINNAEKVGKRSCQVPASNLVKDVLQVIQKTGFIGDFEFIDDGKSGKFAVSLIGKINKVRSIRPRFSVKSNGFEKWERRYLPASDFGVLIVSAPEGVMSQKDAVEKKAGGKLLAYVY